MFSGSSQIPAFQLTMLSPVTVARRAALHHPVTRALQAGYCRISGVDEAGAGALAGPVVAAAVQLLPPAMIVSIPNLDDSKRLSPKRREQVYELLSASDFVEISVVLSPPEYIDEVNILNARLEAMTKALNGLSHTSDLVFVDGNSSLPDLTDRDGNDVEQRLITGGDGKVSLIAAASVVAKVTRDRYMAQREGEYDGFQFSKHFGYPTPKHFEELRKNGPTKIHRWSFKPVRDADGKQNTDNY